MLNTMQLTGRVEMMTLSGNIVIVALSEIQACVFFFFGRYSAMLSTYAFTNNPGTGNGTANATSSSCGNTDIHIYCSCG